MLDDALEELFESGVIEYCNNVIIPDFQSNVFPTSKPDGTARIILNLKQLNVFTEHIHFKMETIKDAVNLMRENCVFAQAWVFTQHSTDYSKYRSTCKQNPIMIMLVFKIT